MKPIVMYTNNQVGLCAKLDNKQNESFWLLINLIELPTSKNSPAH